MNKKAYVLFLLSMGIMLSNIIVGVNAITYFNNVQIEKLSQDPDPGLPNKIIDIKLKVINPSQDFVQNLTVEIEPSWPFKPYLATKKVIKTLTPYQIQSYAQTIEFHVLVDDNVPTGTYKLRVKYYVPGKASVEEDIKINVKNDEILFNIPYINLSPKKLFPGKDAKISFDLENLGTSNAKDVEVNLILPKGINVVGSTNKRLFSKFDIDETKKISYDLAVDSINSGNYQGTIQIKYEDKNREHQYTKEFNFGIVVDVDNNIDSILQNSEYDKGIATVTVNILNSGNAEAKYVEVQLMKNKDYQIIDGNTYIGNIDSADYDSADFKIKTNKSDITIKYQVSWKDYFNKDHVKIFEKNVKIYIPTEQKENKAKKYTIIIIAIILAIFWIFMLVDSIQNQNPNSFKKWLWVAIVILTLPLGAILYYLFGRNNN